MLIRSMLMVAALVIATSPLLADEAAVLSAPDEASIRDLKRADKWLNVLYQHTPVT